MSAFCHETGIGPAEVPVAVTTDKAEAERTVAPRLLAQLDWYGWVFTGDALFCQRHLCQQVLNAGGDSLLMVKDNQLEAVIAIRKYFDPPPALAGFPRFGWRTARTINTKHGRRPEIRDLTAWSDWPGVGRVYRMECT